MLSFARIGVSAEWQGAADSPRRALPALIAAPGAGSPVVCYNGGALRLGDNRQCGKTASHFVAGKNSADALID
jgi:hypothetical protein